MILYHWVPQIAGESAPSLTRSTVSYSRLPPTEFLPDFLMHTNMQSIVMILSQVHNHGQNIMFSFLELQDKITILERSQHTQGLYLMVFN